MPITRNAINTNNADATCQPVPVSLLQWSTTLNAWLYSPSTTTKPHGVRSPNNFYWDGRISGFRHKYQPTMDYIARVAAMDEATARHEAEMSVPRLFGNAQIEFTEERTFSITASLRGDHAPSQWGHFLEVFSKEHFRKYAYGRERGKGKGYIHYQGRLVCESRVIARTCEHRIVTSLRENRSFPIA